MVSFGQFQLKAVAATYPNIRHVSSTCACVPGTACKQLTGANVQREPCPPNIGNLSLITASFWSQRCRQNRRVAIVVALPSCPPPRPAHRCTHYCKRLLLTSRRFKRPVTFSPSFSFSLFPFRKSDIKDWDIKKQLHVWGKLKSDCTCPGIGSEKS